MGRIRVVVDSGADLPADVAREHDIAVVPLTVHFGDEMYLDGVELTGDQFYEKLRSGVMPRTTQPTPGDFVQTYSRIAQPGDTIISVHLSSKLSGTHQSARVAASTLNDYDIRIIDSKSASMGIGLIAIAAAEAAKQGATADECYNRAISVRDSLGVYFVVDTLEYLEKNGRIGKASALLGTLLSIKPVLTLKDGMVTAFERIRGKSKAVKRVLELAEADLGSDTCDVAVVHSDVREEAEQLVKEVKARFHCRKVYTSLIGCTIGTHVGPGTIAILYYKV